MAGFCSTRRRSSSNSSIKRYVDEKPDRNECAPPRKPNTTCLGVLEGAGQIVTYTGSSWSVRSAFTVQLLKPYLRARKLAFPIVSLGFKSGQKDEYGNFLPDFVVTGWTPRSRFADMLGEGQEQPQIAPPTALELPAIARGKQTVTSGRVPVDGRYPVLKRRRTPPAYGSTVLFFRALMVMNDAASAPLALAAFKPPAADAPMLAWALAYTACGMAVFPVNAQRKPLTRRGLKDATTDETQIRGWWTRWPHADPAWAVPSPIVVVDLDCKNGGNGIKDFADHEGAHPDDVATPQASSPTGGRHLVFDTHGATYKNNTHLNGWPSISKRSAGISSCPPAITAAAGSSPSLRRSPRPRD